MANIKISELTTNSSPSTSATLVGVDNGETVQIPISSLPSGGGSGGGASIIDVEDFPTNPSTSVIYRKWQVIKVDVYYGHYLNTDAKVNIVDELPTEGEMAYDGTKMIAYYNRVDDSISGYVDANMSASMGVPSGWYPIGTLVQALGESYGGQITSLDEVITEETFYALVTKKPHLYTYYNNEAEIERSKIITTDSLITYTNQLPSTPQQAIYVITEDEVVKAEAVTDGTILPSGYAYVEIVDELPEDARLGMYASDIYDQALYGYYLTTNGHIYMYADAAIASAMGMAEGWNDLTSYGIVKELHSADEYDSNYMFNVLLTKQPKTRVYVPLPDGTFLELTSGIRTRFDEKSRTTSITEM